MFLLGAEAKSQPVCSGAGTFVRGPRVNHQSSTAAKDVGGTTLVMQIKTKKRSLNTFKNHDFTSEKAKKKR